MSIAPFHQFFLNLFGISREHDVRIPSSAIETARHLELRTRQTAPIAFTVDHPSPVIDIGVDRVVDLEHILPLLTHRPTMYFQVRRHV